MAKSKTPTKAELEKFDPLRIADLHTAGLRERAHFDREAERNLAILFGEHYLIHHVESGRIFRKVHGDGNPRLAIPLIKPLWRKEAANLGKNVPIPEVIPVTNQQDDRDSAAKQGRALDSELARMGFSETYDRLVTWSSAIGCAYIHTMWDAQKKDIVQEVVPHTEIVIPDYVRNSTAEARWIIRAQVMSPDDVFESFGMSVKPNAAPQQQLLNSIQSVKYTGVVSNMANSGVLVLQYWALPSKRYPKGALITVVDNQLCVEETYDEYPYKKMDMLPFVDFHHIHLPGRFAGQSMIRDLWSSQQDYNHSRTKMAVARSLVSSPKIFAAQGTMPGMERLSPIEGEIIPVNVNAAPFMPQVMQMPQLPAHVYASMDNAYREMQDISNTHDISNGIAPGRTPASAVVALQAADSTVIGAIARHMERRVAVVGKQILQLAQQYWTEEHAIRVWSEAEGPAGRWVFESMKNTDLAGQTDVRCVPGSALPKSKEALLERLENYYQLGLITDPNLVLRNANTPGLASVIAAENEDMIHADEENSRWAALSRVKELTDLKDEDIEALPFAEPWHSHAVEIKQHNALRKSASFRGWPKWLREEVARHIKLHEDYLEDERAKAIAEAQMMQGGGAPAPPDGGMGEFGMLGMDDFPVDELGAEDLLSAPPTNDAALVGSMLENDPIL